MIDLNNIFEPIIIAVMLGVGGGCIAYFKKIQKLQEDLCARVEMMRKTIIILAKIIDNQTKRVHPDTNSELDDLVSELLSERSKD